MIRQSLLDMMYWKGKLDAFNMLKSTCWFRTFIPGDSFVPDEKDGDGWWLCGASNGSQCKFGNCPYMKMKK